VQVNLLKTPRLGQIGQGAREARERHELFLAEDFGVLCGVHWRCGRHEGCVCVWLRVEEEEKTLEGR